MRLKGYMIDESRGEEILWNTPQEAYEVITKRCKYYFSLLNGKEPLQRGDATKPEFSKSYIVKKPRKDRAPRGTPRSTFNVVNDLLEEYGHIRRDRSVIATADKDRARFFTGGGKVGVRYYFFPAGHFNYTWVKSRDFNMAEGDYTPWEWIGNIQSATKAKAEEIYEEKIEPYIVTNKKFSKAYLMGYEMWFDPKWYYLVVPDSELGELFEK